ncbi:MAG: hypothetical protein ACI84K_000659 [Pseudohongiellaceae bacterium]|jgi:hypothetical protein
MSLFKHCFGMMRAEFCFEITITEENRMTIRQIALSFVLLAVSAGAFALEKKTFCMYDPVGKNGPAMTFFSDLKVKGIGWGLDIELMPYTDEKVASNDFKAGICDGTFLTSILSGPYVPFGGTMDAIGGIATEEQLNVVLKTLTNPKLSKMLTNGNYEMVGTLPVGSVYLFVNDRNIDTVEEFSGKKVSILNEDPQSLKLANMVGASPVGTSLTTFSGQFNNGNIDILPMVALGYNVFELYHGLGEKGGILDEKLLYGMMQMITYKDHFPADFGQNMREYILSRLPDIHKLVKDAEEEIPSKYWIKTSDKTRTALLKFKREIRLALKAEGVHHPKALRMLWKIRCSTDPTNAECGSPE